MLFLGDPNWKLLFCFSVLSSAKKINEGNSWVNFMAWYSSYATWMVKRVLTKTTRFCSAWLIFSGGNFLTIRFHGAAEIWRVERHKKTSDLDGPKPIFWRKNCWDARGWRHRSFAHPNQMCAWHLYIFIYFFLQRDSCKQIGISAWCIFTIYRRHSLSTYCAEDMRTG